MTETERNTIERIRALAVNYRARAGIYAELGQVLEESNCRALADLHEERARTMERRATAA